MNLNKKIQKFLGDGIPEYNKRINEVIDAANWLLGIRTINGKAIAESDQGPIIDLSQVNSTQPSANPAGTDPDGNQAGWRKITLIDTDGGQFFDVWAWTGSATSNIRRVPWVFDTNQVKASWLTGQEGEVWGTGNYPGTPISTNWQNVKFVYNQTGQSTYNSPLIWTGNVPKIPITPPTSKPAFYLKNSGPFAGSDPNAGPYLAIGGAYAQSVNFTWEIKYDGTVVYSVSGAVSLSGQSPEASFLLDKSGWIFDPSGLPGYSHGSGNWIFEYQGSISGNTNPTIIETFTYSSSLGAAWPLTWDAVLLTG